MKRPMNSERKAGRLFACSALFCRIKEWATIIVCACAIALFIGGCVRVDYRVFKAKYPNAGPGDYVWHRLVE